MSAVQLVGIMFYMAFSELLYYLWQSWVFFVTTAVVVLVLFLGGLLLVRNHKRRYK